MSLQLENQSSGVLNHIKLVAKTEWVGSFDLIFASPPMTIGLGCSLRPIYDITSNLLLLDHGLDNMSGFLRVSREDDSISKDLLSAALNMIEVVT